MNSSFQECYYQPNPPVTSTQGKYPTNAKDLNKSKSGGKKQPSKSGGGGVRLSTDPQSVAARERRHRISHRLKTLQSLVPGAAKLDTVSLLDQAIHYVHFLNSQIQFHQLLLLSDVNSNVINDPPLLLPPRNPCFSSSSCDGDHYFAAVHLSPAAATLPPPSSDAGEGCFFVDLQGVGSSSTLNF